MRQLLGTLDRIVCSLTEGGISGNKAVQSCPKGKVHIPLNGADPFGQLIRKAGAVKHLGHSPDPAVSIQEEIMELAGRRIIDPVDAWLGIKTVCHCLELCSEIRIGSVAVHVRGTALE